MLVPGSNLLKTAFRVIAKQCFNYYRFQSKTPNSIGLDVVTYAPPACMTGSVQPAPRALLEQMGLDLQKTYYNFYMPFPVQDIERDVTGDQIVFNGQTFQCLSSTPWGAIDGWNAVLAVRISV